MFFDDKHTADQIMQAKQPREQKRLGKTIKNFNEELWRKACLEVMKRGLMCKFHQNRILKEKLLNTQGKLLVEASPYDRFWGIGIGKREAEQSFNVWPGHNHLGHLLSDIRDELCTHPIDECD